MSTEPKTLQESIVAMRAIPARWKHLDDPLGELKRIREDPDYNPWESPEWAVPFVPCCAKCKCEVGAAIAKLKE